MRVGGGECGLPAKKIFEDSENQRRGSVTAQAQADRRTQVVTNMLRERTLSGNLEEGLASPKASHRTEGRTNPGTNDRYIGELDGSDLMHGQGKLMFENGDSYEGQFAAGKMQGMGKLFTSGSTYEGLFANDVKHGAGSELFANGDRSVGTWVDGELEGAGTFFLTNGEMFDCVWSRGVMKSRVRARAPAPTADKMSTRDHIVHELLSTERTYVRELTVVMNTYYQGLSDGRAVADLDDVKTLFANLPSILDLNSKFLTIVEARLAIWEPEHTIGDVFINFVEDLKDYTKYVSNHSAATEVLSKLMRKTQWAEFMKTSLMSNGMIRNLDSYLILPVQRIPRYVLFLKELQKQTAKTHPDAPLLVQAYELVDGVARSINEAIKATEQQAELTRLEAKFDEHPYLSTQARSLLKSGPLCRVIGREEKQERAVFVYFLFQDLLAWAVPLSLIAEYDFHLVGKLPRQALEVLASPSDALALDVTYLYNGRVASIQLITRTPEDRNAWLTAFGKNSETPIAAVSSDVTTDCYNSEVAERQSREEQVLQDESTFEAKLFDAKKRAVREHRGAVSLEGGTRYVGPALKEGLSSGVVFLPRQARYEGQILNYAMHGTGIYFTANGSRYEGQFKHGLFWGKGTWFAPNGTCEGRFRAGVQHGPATTFYTDNTVDDSFWVAGQCVIFLTRPIQLPLDLKPLTENLRTVFTYPLPKSNKTTASIASTTINPASVTVDYKTGGFFTKNHQRELTWAKQMVVSVTNPSELVIKLPLSSDATEKQPQKDKKGAVDFVAQGAAETVPLVLTISPVPAFDLSEVLIRFIESEGFPDSELLRAEILLSRCLSLVKSKKAACDTEQGLAVLMEVLTKLRSDLRRITSIEKGIADEVAEQRTIEVNSKKLRDQTAAGVAQARANERAQLITPLQHKSTLLADMLKQLDNEYAQRIKPKIPAQRTNSFIEKVRANTLPRIGSFNPGSGTLPTRSISPNPQDPSIPSSQAFTKFNATIAAATLAVTAQQERKSVSEDPPISITISQPAESTAKPAPVTEQAVIVSENERGTDEAVPITNSTPSAAVEPDAPVSIVIGAPAGSLESTKVASVSEAIAASDATPLALNPENASATHAEAAQPVLATLVVTDSLDSSTDDTQSPTVAIHTATMDDAHMDG